MLARRQVEEDPFQAASDGSAPAFPLDLIFINRRNFKHVMGALGASRDNCHHRSSLLPARFLQIPILTS
jgi:hypothetical protein